MLTYTRRCRRRQYVVIKDIFVSINKRPQRKKPQKGEISYLVKYVANLFEVRLFGPIYFDFRFILVWTITLVKIYIYIYIYTSYIQCKSGFEQLRLLTVPLKHPLFQQLIWPSLLLPLTMQLLLKFFMSHKLSMAIGNRNREVWIVW